MARLFLLRKKLYADSWRRIVKLKFIIIYYHTCIYLKSQKFYNAHAAMILLHDARDIP